MLSTAGVAVDDEEEGGGGKREEETARWDVVEEKENWGDGWRRGCSEQPACVRAEWVVDEWWWMVVVVGGGRDEAEACRVRA